MRNRFYCLLLLLCFSTPLFSQQQVTLNFKDMDINVLIDMVAEVTNKTFIVDPRIKANINVVSSKPMNNSEVYEVFLSILAVHGFAAIETGSVIKIVPNNLAKSENTPVLNGETVRGAEMVTKVIPIEHVAAAQLIPLLRPLVPQQGHLVAYPGNNTLIISDTADNANRIAKIVRRLDRAEQQDVDVMTLQHASASEVVRILTTLEQKQVQADGNTSVTQQPSLVADDRTNSILIGGESADRLRLKALVAHLDTPLQTLTNTKVIYLRYANATELVEVMRGISDTITAQKKAEEGAAAAAAELNKTFIQADESTNSLIITAPPDVMQNLEAVIRKLDVRRAQVLVEAIIADISTDVTKELGVQWIFDGSAKGSSPIGITNFGNAGNGIVDLAGAAFQLDQGVTTNLPTLTPGAFLGLGRVGTDSINFALLLRALASDTNTNILSTPSLLTLDNQEAEITVGQNVPFVTGQFTNTGASNGSTNPFQTIQREDVGIKLKVTPQINEGNAVKLDIEQEVSGLTRSTIATADVIVNKRTIKTSVIVEDGSMIVLGGLIDENLQQNSQKVPGLGDLPVFGGLFRSDRSQKVKRNLMVFLHPKIIRDAVMERQVSNEKYSYIQARQLEQKAQGVPLLKSDVVPVLPSLESFLTSLPGHSPLLPAQAHEVMPSLE